MTNTATSTATITKKIRTTKYIVNVHFCPKGKENISDKILRLIKNDIANEKYSTQQI